VAGSIVERELERTSLAIINIGRGGRLMSTQRFLLVLAASVLVQVGPAYSEDAVGIAGLRIYRDPVTGQWLEQPKPLDDKSAPRGPTLAMPQRDYSQVTTELMPDGSLSLKSNGQLRMAAGVRRKPDGTFEEVCLPAGSDERAPQSEPQR
jgi:hypothetical protein